MGLMPGHVYRALYPCALHDISEDDAIASIHRIFKNDAAPEDIAAIVIEPIQAKAVSMPPPLPLCSACAPFVTSMGSC